MNADDREGARRRRIFALFGLGFREATRGFVTYSSLGIAAALTLLLALFAAPPVGRANAPPLAELGAIASGTLAWGVGVTLAFAWSVSALANDRKNGMVDLLRARGFGLDGYLVVRIAGLATLLVILVSSGTLAVLGVAATVAGTRDAWLDALRTLVATSVYAVAFALVLSTITLACFAARSRVVGYLILVLVLSLPDALAPLLETRFAPAWVDLLSVTRSLGVLRAALSPPGVDGLRAGRASAVLLVFVALAVVALRAQVKRRARDVFV